MSNKDPQKCYESLSANLEYIFRRYLEPHRGNEGNTQEYIYDIKAFYLLVHAELEEFFEVCATYVMDYSINQYVSKKRLNKYLLAMLLYCDCACKKENLSIYDITRKSLERFKTKQSKVIYDNNGMSLENLFNILHPIGIDIVHEAKYIDAINKFSRDRGGFAHTTKIAATLPTVKDIEDLRKDVLALVQVIIADIQDNILGTSIKPLKIQVRPETYLKKRLIVLHYKWRRTLRSFKRKRHWAIVT